MEMSEAEIRCSYKNAKRPKQQIRILAQLNDCSREQIEMILFEKTDMKVRVEATGDVIVDVGELISEYNSGMPQVMIAAKHKIPASTVRRLLVDANVIRKK